MPNIFDFSKLKYTELNDISTHVSQKQSGNKRVPKTPAVMVPEITIVV